MTIDVNDHSCFLQKNNHLIRRRYKMVIYEVNLSIQAEYADRFTKWLKDEHLSEMMSHEDFYELKLFYRKPEEENVDLGKTLLTIHYLVHSRKDLEQYLQKNAEQMRQKAADLFDGHFEVRRRILYSTDLN